MTTQQKTFPHNDPQWKGYTLDELRYQRALVSARVEIQKERIVAEVEKIREGAGFTGSGSIWGRMFSSLSYVEYAILAYRLINRLSRTVHSFRRK